MKSVLPTDEHKQSSTKESTWEGRHNHDFVTTLSFTKTQHLDHESITETSANSSQVIQAATTLCTCDQERLPFITQWTKQKVLQRYMLTEGKIVITKPQSHHAPQATSRSTGKLGFSTFRRYTWIAVALTVSNPFYAKTCSRLELLHGFVDLPATC